MIEVGRNSIIVRNVDEKSKEYKNVLYKYSVYDNVTHKYTYSAFVKYDTSLYFPASIPVSEISACFPKKQILYNTSNTAKAKSLQFAMKNAPRNDLQKKALKFLMTMKKDENCRERFLSLETGSGKTYITINLASKLGKRVLIIVDTLDLADQWKREFLKHTDLTEDSIRILSGADSIEKESKKRSGKVYIAIHRTLSNLISNDFNDINLLMNKLGIGFRVFDESHVNFKNICNINALSNVEYTLYLTATPGRSKFTDDYLYGKVLRSVPYFNGKEIEGEKYLTVIFHQLKTNPSIEWKAKIRTKYGFSLPRWAQFIQDEEYDTLEQHIFDLVDKFKLTERKTAIMLPTLDLIEKVKKSLNTKYPDLDVGTFIGEIPKNKRLEQLNKPLFLTNEKIFDKAIDVKDLVVLINYVQVGSSIKTEQILGRLRYQEGRSSIMIDVTDTGFEETKKQFKLRKRFYKKNKKIKKIIELY